MAPTPRPADALRVGQVFLGKYQVESIIGQGGMGVVAECTHLALNERVALKMLRQDVMLDPDAVERFMREAQAAAKLRSEYVARVSDVGALENGTPYMVMEFLEGQDLGQLVAERGKLGIPWAVELMLQTCEALAEAHSLGIVHRDVKPSNLFVTWRPDGTALIKVLDFGISKTAAGTDMHLTQTQSLLGTPAYMSPEQMRSARTVDARTDIWSLGTVMYELIEGRKPFEAESFSEMCVKVAVDPPEPMVHAPPELQQVVLRCLAKNPDQRYASMADLGRDLVPFTQDPHQAAMLVERMQRMLRRSVGSEWDVSTGTGRSIPQPVGDPGSSPFAVGSEPSAQPLAMAHEASAPAPTPSVELEVPRRNSWFAFALVAAAFVGIASVAIAVTLSDDGAHETSSAEPASLEPEVTTPPHVENAATAETTAAAGTASTPDAGIPDAAPSEVAQPSPPPDTTDGATAAVKPSDRGKKPGSKNAGKSGGKGQTGRVPQSKKPEPKKPPVAEPDCDPFANRHGCTTKAK